MTGWSTVEWSNSLLMFTQEPPCVKLKKYRRCSSFVPPSANGDIETCIACKKDILLTQITFFRLVTRPSFGELMRRVNGMLLHEINRR